MFPGMLLLKDYDKVIEDSFSNMYKGNKQELNSCLHRIFQVIYMTFSKGFITYLTFERMRKVIEEAYDKHVCKIISCNSETIIVLDIENGNIDRFELTDFVIWFVGELLSDPLFRKELNQHYDYQGVMGLFKEISKKDYIDGKWDEALNVVVCSQVVYMVEYVQEVIKLFRVTKGVGKSYKKEYAMDLSSVNLFFDKENDYLYANHADGVGRRIHISDGTEKMLIGEVVALLPGGEVVINKQEMLFLVKDERILIKLGNINSIIMNYEEKGGISWIHNDGKKDMFTRYADDRVMDAHNLKADIVWMYFISKAYKLKGKKNNQLSNKLWIYQCYQTPIPFSAEVIFDRIFRIEKGLGEGIVKKTGEYTQVILPLLQLKPNKKEISDELYDNYNITMKDISVVYTETNALRLPMYYDYFNQGDINELGHDTEDLQEKKTHTENEKTDNRIYYVNELIANIDRKIKELEGGLEREELAKTTKAVNNGQRKDKRKDKKNGKKDIPEE